MEIAASTLVYAGLLIALAGVINLIKPLRWMRVCRRRAALAVFAGGLVLALAAMALPAGDHRAGDATTRLDAFVPAWEFGHRHSILVQAPPERVFRAVKQVSAEEIRLFRMLTWIRNPRRSFSAQPESLLAPPEKQPILEVALRSGFVSLAEDPPREVVVGAVVCCRPLRLAGPEAFARLEEPGFAKAGMSFLLHDEGGGSTRVTTETRVHATDAAASRRFAAYWRVIYPGSALIRRMWLRAIKARAEGAPR